MEIELIVNENNINFISKKLFQMSLQIVKKRKAGKIYTISKTSAVLLQ